ncbi:hypothetical protein NP233_g12718 [Leucocoprinus birnbaumii]|uniref:Tc1-like transposase DDE domain-containing protein n=1 Tax=Leucocoprinus birnbaumii TaxID=56174 RepID=A0AAD5YPR1_9AGAR|nr:hypothetical protein NP233_g12718 [Leucocoprinus birnbaumii]
MSNRAKSARKAAAAHARAHRHPKEASPSPVPPAPQPPLISTPDRPGLDPQTRDDDCTLWKGGINHVDSDDCWSVTSNDAIDDLASSDDKIEEIEVDLIIPNATSQAQSQVQPSASDQAPQSASNAFAHIMQKKTGKEWAKIEESIGGVHTGNSKRRKREIRLTLERKEQLDAGSRQSQTAHGFRSFFTLKSATPVPAQMSELNTTAIPSSHDPSAITPDVSAITNSVSTASINDTVSDNTNRIQFLGYLSDQTEDSDSDNDNSTKAIHPSADFGVIPVPARKRQKLAVPAREARRQVRDEKQAKLQSGYDDVEKLIESKRTVFPGGTHGLQATRARAIHSCLNIMLKNGRGFVRASEIASEGQGFSVVHGGQRLRVWVKAWLDHRELPSSRRGCHSKVYSLLDDPEICTELRAYLRSNKWSMNPHKVTLFAQDKLIPEEASKYLIDDEMPSALTQYLDLELLPRLQIKAKKGVSLRTARRWLHKEGFRYSAHKKAVYYDGHEREDVVDYRQNVFIPQMRAYERRLVKFEVGNVENEVPLNLEPGERPLVLVAQDEMTAQCNDGQQWSWIWKGEQPLKKKGVGRGLHQSDVIASTVGWLKDASRTLEYGKNYEGYWNGELFVKQIKEQIIPAFERAYPPNYQMLLMVDNSQGHSAYAEDALLVSRMNMGPGGKQAMLRDGWYIGQDGRRITQKMVFPSDHPDFPGQPKGLRQVLEERGLFRKGLVLMCRKSKDGTRDKCASGATDCCARRILELQPDFQEQRSLVQEVVEQAGHLCIILPKFHCELNPIEFFWGAVKRHLRDNCDYTFTTLQQNMPTALSSVRVELIRKWEHRMWRWIGAYEGGLDAKDALKQVREFSSRKFASHRRIPEGVARQMDGE